MTPLNNYLTADPPGEILPFNVPVGRLTENILALSDAAVIISQRNKVCHCTCSIETLLEVSREEVMRTGWDYLTQLIHPTDLRMLRKKVLPELRAHFRTLTDQQRLNRTFNFTLRMRVANDKYSLFAMENRPLQWKRKDWPSAIVSIVRDISVFGAKGELVLTVLESGRNRTYNTILKRNYSVASQKFTGREAEIIRYVAGGLTSIQIADRLCLSPDTVRNHRKKILRKAGCTTSTALTSLALNHGII